MAPQMVSALTLVIVLDSMRFHIDWPMRRMRAAPNVWSKLSSVSMRG